MATREDLEDQLGRIAAGDQRAHAALYDCTAAKLFAVSIRILGNVQDAEDAMHDSYLKIWRHAGRYRASGHSPMTWLITIARNTAIDRLRARRATEPYEERAESLPSPLPDPEAAAIAAGTRDRLQRCLDDLPADRRRAVLGAYLEGRSYAELAEQAAVPLNTMRSWLRRSLIALRACLGA